MTTRMQEHAHENAPSRGRPAPACSDSATEHDPGLEPLLAGARARGMVEAFDLAGFGAILLDGQANVLFASPRARSLMADMVRIARQQLVGETSATNRLVQRCIQQALSGGGHRTEAVLAEAGRNSKYLKIRAVCVPGAETDPMQLAKAVLLLEAC